MLYLAVNRFSGTHSKHLYKKSRNVSSVESRISCKDLVFGSLILPFEFGIGIGSPSDSKNKSERLPRLSNSIGGKPMTSSMYPI